MSSTVRVATQPSSSLARVGSAHDGRQVAGPAADDVVGDRRTRGAFERLDHLQHRGAPARPEVPGADRLVGGRDPVERRDMAGGEVLDVDVVALAGAVGRGVVVAEDAQPVATTHGDLRDERHEVVGDPLRVLADRAGRVRADGVEVAQDRDAPRGVDVRDIAQHHLDHHLGPPVRAVGLERLVVLAIGQREPGRRTRSRTRRTPASSSRAVAWLAAARTSTGGCSRSSPVAAAHFHRRPSAPRSGRPRRSAPWRRDVPSCRGR